MSLVEVLVAAVILVLLVVPLVVVLDTTSKGVGVSQNYQVAQNLAQMLYEYAAFYGNTDDTTSFEAVESMLEVPETVTSPYTGCKGRPISDLATSPTDVLMPSDGDGRFDFGGSDPSFANLFKQFSYTLDIEKSTKDTVVTTDSKAALFRMDVKVYWKGHDGKERVFPYGNYLARRKY